MKGNMDLVNNLCRRFCSYYKPSKEEDLACRGFVVVKRLTEMGKQIPFEEPGRRPGALTEGTLMTVLCPTCPFYEGDCDFILKEGDSLPCGGFIFLGLLLDNGIISIDDVRNIE